MLWKLVRRVLALAIVLGVVAFGADVIRMWAVPRHEVRRALTGAEAARTADALFAKTPERWRTHLQVQEAFIKGGYKKHDRVVVVSRRTSYVPGRLYKIHQLAVMVANWIAPTANAQGYHSSDGDMSFQYWGPDQWPDPNNPVWQSEVTYFPAGGVGSADGGPQYSVNDWTIIHYVFLPWPDYPPYYGWFQVCWYGVCATGAYINYCGGVRICEP